MRPTWDPTDHLPDMKTSSLYVVSARRSKQVTRREKASISLLRMFSFETISWGVFRLKKSKTTSGKSSLCAMAFMVEETWRSNRHLIEDHSVRLKSVLLDELVGLLDLFVALQLALMILVVLVEIVLKWSKRKRHLRRSKVEALFWGLRLCSFQCPRETGLTVNSVFLNQQ